MAHKKGIEMREGNRQTEKETFLVVLNYYGSKSNKR